MPSAGMGAKKRPGENRPMMIRQSRLQTESSSESASASKQGHVFYDKKYLPPLDEFRTYTKPHCCEILLVFIT